MVPYPRQQIWTKMNFGCARSATISGHPVRSNSPEDKKVRSEKRRRVTPDLTREAAAEAFRECRERQRNASHPRSLQNRVCSLRTLSYSNETGVVAGDAGGEGGDVDLCRVTTKKFQSEKRFVTHDATMNALRNLDVDDFTLSFVDAYTKAAKILQSIMYTPFHFWTLHKKMFLHEALQCTSQDCKITLENCMHGLSKISPERKICFPWSCILREISDIWFCGSGDGQIYY